MTSSSLSTRRSNCATCLRAASDCICHLAVAVASRVEVLVLQHPLEVRNAKNSARLLHLCLPGSRLAVGETFDPGELASLLAAGGRTPVLLYPATPGAPAPAADLSRPESLRLVVLDGTWRKSRKMLHLNPLLQGLPRLALEDVPSSNYRIRKAHAPHQLSTLEATAHALAQMEKNSLHYQPLMAAFDGFVQQQSAKIAHLNPS